MPRFQVDVQVYATAYVEADDEAEALVRLCDAVGKDVWFEVANDHIDIAPYVQLSPAMTSHGFNPADMECDDD